MNLLSRFRFLKNFYVATGIGLVIWLMFFAQNDIPSQIKNWYKLRQVDNEKAYYLEQIELLKKEQNQTLGNDKLVEKYAREKYYMKKPTEDIYVLVNEKEEEVEK